MKEEASMENDNRQDYGRDRDDRMNNGSSISDTTQDVREENAAPDTPGSERFDAAEGAAQERGGSDEVPNPDYGNVAQDRNYGDEVSNPNHDDASQEAASAGEPAETYTGEAEVDYSVARGSSVRVTPSRSFYHDETIPIHDGEEAASFRNESAADGSTSFSDAFTGNDSGYHDGGSADGNSPDPSQTSSSSNIGTPGFGAPGYNKNTDSGKKKSGTAQKVIACLLVIVLCGAAGFGGGYLAGRTGNSSGGSSSSGGTTNVTISGDVTSLDAASAIAEKVMPSVVGISTVTQTQTQTIFGIQTGQTQGVGTGLIVTEDGYILTNSHVVDDGEAETITVDLYDGTEYSGQVLWNDSSLDLAIVKIDASNLTAAELGDSDEVLIGDYAMAIGNPLGLNFERSVTSGIISGLNRSITTTDSSGTASNTMEGLIQTDASINSGNSGGPLINSSGQVIGINTAKASSAEGLGFAIPINTAIPIIEQIRETGSYESSYIGISGADLSTVMANYQTNFNASSGVYVVQIYTDSPAATAGLKEGDIITSIDGTEVEGMSSLKSLLVSHSPGETVEITVERDRQTFTVSLTLGSASEASTAIAPSSESDSSGSYSYGNDNNSGNSETPGSSGSSQDSWGSMFGGMFGN